MAVPKSKDPAGDLSGRRQPNEGLKRIRWEEEDTRDDSSSAPASKRRPEPASQDTPGANIRGSGGGYPPPPHRPQGGTENIMEGGWHYHSGLW